MSSDYQEQLKAQMEQCPFCKIAKGEIPAQVVYSDEDIMAVLDINPLKKGHIIVFPKQHVPIIQMVPKKTQDALFSTLPSLVKAVKDATVSTSSTLFVASGGVAGQQMPHMMLHIIPREHNDGVENFTKKVIQPDIQAIREPLKKATQQVLEKIAIREEVLEEEEKNTQKIASNQSIEQNRAQVQNQPSEEQKKMIAEYLEQNQDMYELLINDPQKFAENIIKDPKLKNTFAGIDLRALSKRLKEAQ
jgi:histidine triad (HIT) family protein